MLKTFVDPEKYDGFISILKEIKDGTLKKHCRILNIYGGKSSGKSTICDLIMKLTPGRNTRIKGPISAEAVLASQNLFRPSKNGRDENSVVIHLTEHRGKLTRTDVYGITQALIVLNEKYQGGSNIPTLIIVSIDLLIVDPVLRDREVSEMIGLSNSFDPRLNPDRSKIVEKCLEEMEELTPKKPVGIKVDLQQSIASFQEVFKAQSEMLISAVQNALDFNLSELEEISSIMIDLVKNDHGPFNKTYCISLHNGRPYIKISFKNSEKLPLAMMLSFEKQYETFFLHEFGNIGTAILKTGRTFDSLPKVIEELSSGTFMVKFLSEAVEILTKNKQ